MLARMMNRLWRREVGSGVGRRQSVRLGLCTLEQRDTPATLSVVNGVATYTPAPGLPHSEISLTYTPIWGGVYSVVNPDDPQGAQNFWATGVNTVTINAGADTGDDTVAVKALPGVTLNVNTGAGNDTVQVGSPSGNTLSKVQGTINIDTGSGNVGNVTVFDQNGTLGRFYDFHTGGVTISGGPTVNLKNVLGVSVKAGNGDDTFNLPSGTRVTSVDGGGGTNTLTTPTAGAGFYVNGQNSEVLFATLFTNVQNLLGAPGDPNVGGATGDSSFHFLPGGQLTGWAHGQSGENLLDYSALSSNVIVNLSTGQASLVGGGISGIADATGGEGNDILIGNAQNNVLQGMGGNDLIVGGAGNDVLVGGGGQDIIVAGTTGWMANTDLFSPTSWLAVSSEIRTEWTSGDSLSQRFQVTNQELGPIQHDPTGHDTIINVGDGAVDVIYLNPNLDSFQFSLAEPDKFVSI